jgi:hypothetical protein
MTQHSWYNKNRRHYGRKPNTRRARGLKRRDAGKKRIYQKLKTFDNLEEVRDREVEVVPVPRSMSVLKRYIRMYNMYVNRYQLFRDKKVCIELVMKKFGVQTSRTVEKAIKVCKYIIATAGDDEEE